MNLFALIGEWFWLLALFFSLFYFRSPGALKTRMEEDQGFADTQLRLRRRMVVLMAVPWLVMGAGQLFGGIPYVWNYFRPQDQNTWVFAFYAAVLILWCVSIYWVFFLNGAKLAAEHQSFGKLSPSIR